MEEKFYICDYWAEWCGPCRALAPIIEKVTTELNVPLKKINIEEVDVTDLNIRSIPTVIAFKDGKEVGRLVGMTTPAELIKFIQEHNG